MNVTNIVLSALREVLKDKPSGTVLDVGAGTGYMHSLVEGLGYTYFAIDTDSSVRLKLEERGIPVLNSYDDLARLGITVDVVLLGNMMFTEAPTDIFVNDVIPYSVKVIEWDVYHGGAVDIGISSTEV